MSRLKPVLWLENYMFKLCAKALARKINQGLFASLHQLKHILPGGGGCPDPCQFINMLLDYVELPENGQQRNAGIDKKEPGN